MRIRGIVGLISAVSLCFGLSACQTDGGGDGKSTASDSSKGTKIALMMSHMSNSFTTTVAKAAQEESQKLGLEITVFDGKKDVSTQISQIESAITQGYKGILVEPVSKEGIIPGLKAANDGNVPIVTLIQQAQDQSLARAYVGGDDTAAGKLQMEEAIKAIGGKGNVALLYGPMGSDGQVQRKAGYDEVLKEYPDVKVVFEQTANWDTAEALSVTENWLSTGKGIDAIVAQNDSMSLGALKALTDSNKAKDVKVFGVDATEDGLASIKDGGLSGTVSQDTSGMGRMGVDILKKVIDGEKVDDLNFSKATWITAKNVDSLM